MGLKEQAASAMQPVTRANPVEVGKLALGEEELGSRIRVS